ncbi:signal recognition particle 54 kDa, partial [Raphidocelis subcapitata]
EHIDQFEIFETRRFVSRLLGRGDVGGLMDKIQDVIPEDKQPELLDSISRGNVTMRVMRDVFESFLSMGPVSQIMGMIPGFNADMFGGGASGDRQSSLQIKRYITIIESMTEKELDTTNIRLLQEPSRIERLARGFIKEPRYGDAFVKIRGEIWKDAKGKYPGSALLTIANFATPGIE